MKKLLLILLLFFPVHGAWAEKVYLTCSINKVKKGTDNILTPAHQIIAMPVSRFSESRTWPQEISLILGGHKTTIYCEYRCNLEHYGNSLK